MYDHVEDGVFTLTMHPQVTGQPPRLRYLEALVGYMRAKPNVEFATLDDIVARFRVMSFSYVRGRDANQPCEMAPQSVARPEDMWISPESPVRCSESGRIPSIKPHIRVHMTTIRFCNRISV